MVDCNCVGRVARETVEEFGVEHGQDLGGAEQIPQECNALGSVGEFGYLTEDLVFGGDGSMGSIE